MSMWTDEVGCPKEKMLELCFLVTLWQFPPAEIFALPCKPSQPVATLLSLWPSSESKALIAGTGSSQLSR